jgi:hypothetical protein
MTRLEAQSKKSDAVDDMKGPTGKHVQQLLVRGRYGTTWGVFVVQRKNKSLEQM